MPQFRRKPEVIEAVQFAPGVPLPVGTQIEYGIDTPWRVWNALHESWIGFRAGDWLRVDNPEDVYPIDAATFARTYEPLEEP